VAAPTSDPPGGSALERLFHRVNRVIPETQEVVAVAPTTTVGEALRLLHDSRFSQLPVVRGVEVLGSFSYRSFAQGAVRLPEGHGPLEELPVDEFLEDLEIAYVNEELASVLPALDRDDAVLIGTPNDLQAIITPMDVLRYLYRLTEPYVQLGEIEGALRAVVAASVNHQELAACSRHALIHEYQGHEDELPARPEDMTLAELVSVIRDGRNWGYFKAVLGSRRELVAARLRPLPGLRNDVFHFRRELTEDDRTTITEVRNWLLGKLRGTALVEGADG
jgi:CBS domain-containing protein